MIMAKQTEPKRPSKEAEYHKKLYSARAEVEFGDATEHTLGKKREDYLTWKQFYMSVAFLSAQRSRDPNTKVY